MPIRVALLTLFILAVPLAPCWSNEATKTILSFPDISAFEFRPDKAVLCANSLILLGKNTACAQLRELSKKQGNDDWKVNQKICHLCRLLFMPRSPRKPLRPPGLGASDLLPYNSMAELDWPYMPFAIVNDVPLSMTLGYSLRGGAEKAEDYLSYCLSNGVFRTELFPVPTSHAVAIALDEILNSPEWKALKWTDSGPGWSYSLDQSYAKKMLRKQVDNMANHEVEQTARAPLLLSPVKLVRFQASFTCRSRTTAHF